MTERRSTGRAGTEQTKVKGKKPKKRKFGARRALTWMFFTAALAVVCGIIGYLLIILNGERLLAENQGKLVSAESSIIYDVNGNDVSRLYEENRESVDFSQIPDMMKQAFVAVEDRRFYEHSGLDFISIGRAVVKDVIARSAVEGGSTITQQLAKNVFLSHDKTILRKATEASIAVALENNMTKDQILEMYLNRIYFGRGAHGVKAASKLYFGKEDLNDLELWEIATLAGMPKAPNSYNPLSDPERSMERRAVVLQLMYDQGLITAEEMEQAKNHEYNPDAAEPASNTNFMAYVDYAIEEAMKVTNLTEEELRLGGYHIYTSLNPNAQTIMEGAFADDSNFEQSPSDQKVQGAMIIIDHRTGEIEAMVGGRDYEKKGWNRVVQPRQPGSSFKPITSYGPALETGEWFPWSTLRDDKECFNGYCPTDSNRVKYIGPVSMKQAIKESRNLPAVWLLNQVGVSAGLEFANTLGFDLSSDDRNLAIALGGLTHGVTPMQMATAYSVFANGGRSVDPHSIVEIKDKNGQSVYEYKAPKVRQLIAPETAWYLTEIMQGVVEQGGTGTRARIDRPVAGKTGTTQHGIEGLRSSGNRDAWFVGYTPEWTAAVWMGYDKTDAEHLLKQSSGQSAALFAKVMSAALKDAPRSEFKRPSSIKEITPPAQVGGFNASYIQERGEVQMAWTAVQGQNITYRVYRKEVSEQEFKVILDQVDAIAANDIGIEQGKTYEYYVTAYDSVNNLEGPASWKKTITIPVEELVPIEPDPSVEPQIPDDTGTVGPGEGEVPPVQEVPDNGAGEPGSQTPLPDNGATAPEGQQPSPDQPTNGAGVNVPPDGAGGTNGTNGNAGANGVAPDTEADASTNAPNANNG
ncbi:PBP1A family penicillin-binding protein [Paenibacillus abyssi]|uniref:Penicillin-binding protein 1F n=1 Tax=Paenibacillus abyssi TaxID=1340531 RepID=A0A917FME6_9BACL|nr:PBP1A family penicillin-binding protein [Paenibacillus abyssi]GGF89715.1 penicillin-binding protein 1F [Paenibacillus abyssi]